MVAFAVAACRMSPLCNSLARPSDWRLSAGIDVLTRRRSRSSPPLPLLPSRTGDTGFGFPPFARIWRNCFCVCSYRPFAWRASFDWSLRSRFCRLSCSPTSSPIALTFSSVCDYCMFRSPWFWHWHAAFPRYV